jgi:hypothetical protein
MEHDAQRRRRLACPGGYESFVHRRAWKTVSVVLHLQSNKPPEDGRVLHQVFNHAALLGKGVAGCLRIGQHSKVGLASSGGLRSGLGVHRLRLELGRALLEDSFIDVVPSGVVGVVETPLACRGRGLRLTHVPCRRWPLEAHIVAEDTSDGVVPYWNHTGEERHDALALDVLQIETQLMRPAWH